MISTILDAIGRMTPHPADIASLAERFAQEEADCACLGYVLAAYLADVITAAADLHAIECRNPHCYTCAGLATALLGLQAHHYLVNSPPTGQDLRP